MNWKQFTLDSEHRQWVSSAVDVDGKKWTDDPNHEHTDATGIMASWNTLKA